LKAAVYKNYGPPEVLKIEEIERPVPKDNEILIKIHATTVTAVDSIFRNGKSFFARMATGIMKPKNKILGSELAGEVEAIGNNVRLFKPGDKVMGDSSIKSSTYAEYICLRDDEPLVLLPSSLSYDEAASICYGSLTALPFLRDNGQVQKGHKVLVIGASGAVGTFAVQIAKYFGAEVTGVCSNANIGIVKSLGADNVIDYTKQDFTKSGDTYDVVFDTVGKSSFGKCKSVLRQNGIYLTTVVGFRILFHMLMTSRAKKKAVIAFTGLRSTAERSKDLIFIKELVEKGKLKPIIDRKYQLADIVEAHKYVDQGHKKGSVIISLIQE
jgi:NADPH:quinone reductase-like Zn-dependent oxidoreductase